MKTRISFISLFILLVPFVIKSQVTDNVSKFLYENDSIIKRFVKVLPSSWTFSASDSTIIISKNDSVIIAARKLLHFAGGKGKGIALPLDTILKYGHKGKSEIIYKYEPRWTDEQKLSAQSNNNEISQQIDALPGKYGITYLLDKSKSSDRNNVYTGHNANEIQLVKKFETEKNQLLSKMIALPTNNTVKYSFFFKSISGYNDNNNLVYPLEAYQQFYDLRSLFNQLTEPAY